MTGRGTSPHVCHTGTRPFSALDVDSCHCAAPCLRCPRLHSGKEVPRSHVSSAPLRPRFEPHFASLRGERPPVPGVVVSSVLAPAGRCSKLRDLIARDPQACLTERSHFWFLVLFCAPAASRCVVRDFAAAKVGRRQGLQGFPRFSQKLFSAGCKNFSAAQGCENSGHPPLQALSLAPSLMHRQNPETNREATSDATNI